MTTLPVSVVIHTKNCVEDLPRAIASVKNWASEIVVVDMKSADGTAEKARELGARVITVPDAAYADPARNTGIQAARQPWVFMLDADEEVQAALVTKLAEIVEHEEISGIEIPRKNLIFGEWAKTGWWPDYIARIFRANRTTWPTGLHSKPIISGKVIQIPAEESLALIHHHYVSVAQFVDRMNRYTSISAEESSGVPQLSLPSFVADEFFGRYFARGGVDQGTFGLILSSLQASSFVIDWAKRWERNGKQDQDSIESFDQDLDRITQDLAYWIADQRVARSKNIMQKIYWMLRRKLKI